MAKILDPAPRACRPERADYRCRSWSNERLEAAARLRLRLIELLIVLLIASVAAVWLARLA